MVAGTRGEATASTTATVWTSPDTVTWTPAALTGPGVSSRGDDAVDWKGTTIVVGSVGAGADTRAEVWVSQAAGSQFRAVAIASANDSASSMDHVAAGNLGYFATGTVSGQPAVWYSTNGLQWSISSAATHFLDGFPGARIDALLETSNFVYAAGSVRDGNATDAALWSTQDGINWRPIVPGQGAFSGGGNHVITGLAPLGTLPAGGGLLAVGGLQAGGIWTPVSWISPDGVSWSQPAAAFPRASGSGDAVVRSVTAVATLVGPSAFVAAGGGAGGQYLWQSTDGVRWTQIPLPGTASTATGWQATLVASTGATTVVADDDSGQAHLLANTAKGWSEPSATAAEFGPLSATADAVSLAQSGSDIELTVRLTQAPQAVGDVTVTTAMLSSSDGVNWATTPPPGATPAQPAVSPPGWATAIGKLATTWLAVGSGTPGSLTAGAGSVTEGEALSSASPDGTHWGSPETLDPKPGIATESPTGLCSDNSTAAAVGEVSLPSSGVQAAAWYTTDGSHWKVAAVSPGGGADEMLGCVAASGSFEGYGGTSGTGGDSPALWSSPDGSHWTRGDASLFGSGAPGPISSLAASGNDWLVVASEGMDGEPDGYPYASLPPSTAPVGDQIGVWTSDNRGSTWQRQDGSGTVWQDAAGALLEQVGYVGSRAVVAGQIGGRLVVWTGTRA